MTTILRPLSTSELLDHTFHLYRNRFVMFVGIAAIPQVAMFAIHLADHANWFRAVITSRGARIALLYLVAFLAVQIAHAATVSAVSSLHLGSHSDIWSAYAAVKNSLLRAIWISLAAFAIPFGIAFVIGIVAVGLVAASFGLLGGGMLGPSSIFAVLLVLFVFAPFGAMRWWINWSLVVPVTVLEGGGLRATLRRSRSLVEGRRWRVFVIYLLVIGLNWTVTILLQTPFYAMIQWRGFMRAAHISDTAVLVSAIGSFVSQSFVVPLLTIAFTLLYYDERVRREGFDLQWMISTLEATRENPTAAPASL